MTDLRADSRVTPLGHGAAVPRLSWRLESSVRGTAQSAYQVRVAHSLGELARQPLWDSGRVPSSTSLHVPYGGPPVASGTRYLWQVRVWGADGRPSGWSEPTWWETGILRPGEWKAEWITSNLPSDTSWSSPSPLLRHDFIVDGRVASARAYVTSLGVYEMELNGARVGDQLLTPGWTAYDSRVQYQAYDVTAMLRPGPNAVGAMLGNGWYRGRIAHQPKRRGYGDQLALLAQIVIRYADGREQVVRTDGSWLASTGPVLRSDLFDGEVYDARREPTGWSRPGFAAAGWTPVRVLPHSKEVLVASEAPPVRRMQELRPIAILRTPDGRTVFDMGQNMVGWVRLRVDGPAGTTVVLRHAEVLDRSGNLYTDNLRSAKQEIRYTLRGGGPERYEPRFTFQGFRYVAVEGYPGTPTLDDVRGIVVHSDLPTTGEFATSNAMLNQLQRNIVWGQRGNFLDVPTDCPQRDERLGWTGDAQVFARTAAFNMDVSAFFSKWLADLAADQGPGGSVPVVVPKQPGPPPGPGSSAAGWGDAAVIIPWTMYLTYGDRELLARQFESMRRWVEYERASAGPDLIWRPGWQFGDWLAFATTRSDYQGATTDKDLIATAFFAHSADLVARSARVLGREAEAREYGALFERIRTAFQREFLTGAGRLASHTQTAYALGLRFDLLPPEMRDAAAAHLAADVQRFGHLTTGFLGTPHLAPALSENGHLDRAYTLLLREKYPSWLYPVTRGATTIWERWDGIRPDSTFQDPRMNSFNHYAYGAIGEWMYGTVAGLELDPAEPAYRHVRIQPRPGGGLTHAKARLESPYGTVGSEWVRDSTSFTLTATVPSNARGTVRLPGATLAEVREGRVAVARAPGVRRAFQEGADVVVEVGSGVYRFRFPVARTPTAEGRTAGR